VPGTKIHVRPAHRRGCAWGPVAGSPGGACFNGGSWRARWACQTRAVIGASGHCLLQIREFMVKSPPARWSVAYPAIPNRLCVRCSAVFNKLSGGWPAGVRPAEGQLGPAPEGTHRRHKGGGQTAVIS